MQSNQINNITWPSNHRSSQRRLCRTYWHSYRRRMFDHLGLHHPPERMIAISLTDPFGTEKNRCYATWLLRHQPKSVNNKTGI